MKKTIVILLLTIGAAFAQELPPETQMTLVIWVDDDGTQGFQLAVTFMEEIDNDGTAYALEQLRYQLADRRWCLDGWVVDETTSQPPIVRRLGPGVSLIGRCK